MNPLVPEQPTMSGERFHDCFQMLGKTSLMDPVASTRAQSLYPASLSVDKPSKFGMHLRYGIISPNLRSPHYLRGHISNDVRRCVKHSARMVRRPKARENRRSSKREESVPHVDRILSFPLTSNGVYTVTYKRSQGWDKIFRPSRLSVPEYISCKWETIKGHLTLKFCHDIFHFWFWT